MLFAEDLIDVSVSFRYISCEVRYRIDSNGVSVLRLADSSHSQFNSELCLLKFHMKDFIICHMAPPLFAPTKLFFVNELKRPHPS